jgi:hypothetical protein
MQQYSIHKTGKQYVVRAEKDLLICESRREAEHIIFDVANSAETSVSRPGSLASLVAVKEPPCSNADVLAKAVLDIKLILDIEKSLTMISLPVRLGNRDPFKIRYWPFWTRRMLSARPSEYRRAFAVSRW